MNPNHPATQLWLTDLDCAATALIACDASAPRLAPGDLVRLQSIADPVTQRLRRVAYIAQRLVLERLFGPAIRGVELPRDAHGRPHLPPGFIGCVSLAHTGRFALIAASRSAARIGVDLESPRPIRMAPARRHIIEAAASLLAPQELPPTPDARFLQAWTRLEALAKADGHGIGHILTAIGAVGRPRGAHDPVHLRAAATVAASHSLQIHDLDAGPDLYASVACDTAPPALQRVTGDLTALLSPA